MIRISCFMVLLTFFIKLDLLGQTSDNFLSIGITPTELFDPITSSIAVSVEQKIAPKINVELMYGFDPNVKFLDWHPDPESRHHEYKLSLKYLFVLEEKNFSDYVGIDFFGSYNEYERASGYYEEGNVAYYFDEANIIRSVYGCRANYGMKFSMTEKVWLDFFMGAGIRNVSIEYAPERRRVVEYAISDGSLISFDRTAGDSWKLALILGLKMEYRIF